MIFGYARVSTKDQNLERQLQYWNKFVTKLLLKRNLGSPPAKGQNY